MKKLYTKYDSQLQVPSAAPYYWKEALRISKDNYSPTKEDIIRAKLRTIGINETNVNYENLDLTFIDVGGQRSERRKWLHCFDNCYAVIYICAIDEYDGKVLEEDHSVDRLEESIKLFNRLIHSMSFHNVPFILFLNKIDLFEEKLKNFPLESLTEKYPDFNKFKKRCKESGDVKIGIEYFSQKFRDVSNGKTLYIFETNSIDEDQCQKVLVALTDYVLSKVMSQRNDY